MEGDAAPGARARGREVLGLPIFMPRDSAIPAKEVPAQAAFTRPFLLDKANLQREQKAGVSPWLTIGAYLLVLAVYLAVLGLLAWGLRRLESRLEGPATPRAQRTNAPRLSGVRPSTA